MSDERTRRRPHKNPKKALSSASEATATATRARLFWNGRSQAVRLPKEFRFEGDEVSIRREGRGVVLEPVDKPAWPAGYWERIDALTRDFRFPDAVPVGGRLLDLSLAVDP